MTTTEKASIANSKPGGPAPSWRNKLAFWRDPLSFTLQVQEYGEIVRWLDWPQYFLNQPEDIEIVLGKHQLQFDRNFRAGFLHRLLGNGLLSSSGEFWLRQRRLTQPAFHRERLEAYGVIMTDLIKRLLTGWQTGQVRDIHADMMQLTLDVVARVFFSHENNEHTAQVGAAFDQIVKLANWQRNPLKLVWTMLMLRLSQNPRLNERIPFLKNYQSPAEQALATLNEVIYNIIQQRRKLRQEEEQSQQQSDLLSLLMQAQDEEGKGMSDQQLRDEVLTMFIAGHETTAVTLSWALYLLDKHPAVQEKLLTELKAELNGQLPKVADLPRLRYLEQVVKETLRLYPPLWLSPRRLLTEGSTYEIRGYQFSSEDILNINIYGVHHNPKFYPEPFEFQPERWSDELAKNLPRCAYLPFGAGPRQCIGRAFGMQEAMLILATILQKYKLELVQGQKVKAVPSLTLRPRGLKMLVRTRA